MKTSLLGIWKATKSTPGSSLIWKSGSSVCLKSITVDDKKSAQIPCAKQEKKLTTAIWLTAF